MWSQLVASGTYFADMSNPQVMLQVGNYGDVGTIEISDMLFTSIGALPGLVMVEWNIAADSQGSVSHQPLISELVSLWRSTSSEAGGTEMGNTC